MGDPVADLLREVAGLPAPGKAAESGTGDPGQDVEMATDGEAAPAAAKPSDGEAGAASAEAETPAEEKRAGEKRAEETAEEEAAEEKTAEEVSTEKKPEAGGDAKTADDD